MKLELKFELENNKIPFDFRKGVISFLKNALNEYNKSFYDDIYNNCKKKSLTFCPFMRIETKDIKERMFYLKDNFFKVTLSSGDDMNIYKFFVSLQKQVNKKYPFYNKIGLENNSENVKIGKFYHNQTDKKEFPIDSYKNRWISAL